MCNANVLPRYNRQAAQILLDNMTPEQAQTLLLYYAIQARESLTPKDWPTFFGAARWDGYIDCVMFAYAGMWMGIERDGYTHS